MGDKEILAKTVYLEARGEPTEGWRGVAFVIMNRAKLNKSYWGGSSVGGVCSKRGQFECWNPGQNQTVDDASLYKRIKHYTDLIYDGIDQDDPTSGSDHYNNPRIENPPPDWTKNCRKTVMIGEHQFYKSKNL